MLQAELNEIHHYLRHFDERHHLHHRKMKRKKILETKLIELAASDLKVIEA